MAWVGFGSVKVRLGLGFVWLGLGLARVGSSWHGIARVDLGSVGLLYSILLDSIFGTALLDVISK